MHRYIIKRILILVPTLLLVSFVIFFIIRLVPGDPIETMFGDYYATQELIDRYEKTYGLDKPIVVQYLYWLKEVSKGNFGTSIVSRGKVSKIILDSIEPTISLASLGFLISIILGFMFGILSAINRGKKSDLLISVLCFIGVSTPIFLISIFLMYLFSVKLNILPTIGYEHLFKSGFVPWLRHLILPSISIGVVTAAANARMIRTTLVNVLLDKYIITARSKGLKERVVIFKHALKNALIPVITVLGITLSRLLGGVVIVENVFAFPGLGRQIVYAVLKRDYHVLQAGILLFSFIFIVINLITDILYVWIDPRIKY